MAIFSVPNGRFQWTLEEQPSKSAMCLRRSGASDAFMTSCLPLRARLQEGWSGCELCHSVMLTLADDWFRNASRGEKVTHLRLKLPSSRSLQESNRHRRGGKSGSAKFDSLGALGARRRTSAKRYCFYVKGIVTRYEKLWENPLGAIC